MGPPKIWGWGVAERGSKGHTLTPSIQMPEILPPTISKGWEGGGGSACSQGTPPRASVPVAGNAGTL